MFISFRHAALIAGLLIGSGALAQGQAPAAGAEPLIETSAATLPAAVTPQPIIVDSDAVPDAAVADSTSTVPTSLATAKAAGPAQSSVPGQRAASRGPALASTTAGSASLASLVAQLRASDVASRELECLAGAIYFESKSEPLVGQLAVGQVIANRTKSGRFPTSYCGVVFQRGQFSFIRNRAMPAISRSSLQWRTAVAIAHIVDRAMHVGTATKALFFHARRVSPGWRLTRLATIGNHVFYR